MQARAHITEKGKRKRATRKNGLFSGVREDLFGPPKGRSVFGYEHVKHAKAARAQDAEMKREAARQQKQERTE